MKRFCKFIATEPVASYLWGILTGVVAGSLVTFVIMWGGQK